MVGAAVLLPELRETGPGRWLLLGLVFLLGVVAMLPWGAVLGSVFRTMMGLAWAMISMYAVAALSGVFYPVAGWPAPLQWLAQLSPLYWIGVAVRSVLLPESAAAAEVGGSSASCWRWGCSSPGPSSGCSWLPCCCGGWRGVSPAARCRRRASGVLAKGY
ncbi:ABC transporter permease [Serinicoccus marinus]|uniref:ABC transporter permease n=1 Tax=Serinicoccus marinus TaxID=247333 RepID=UPI00122DCA41|nr:ABC transporter permease [Serinicoccus marinus]